MVRLHVQLPNSPKKTVIAKLVELSAPDDIIREIEATQASSRDGVVRMILKPTAENQAYRLSVVPKTAGIPDRMVQVPGGVSDIQWEDLIDVNPSTLAPYATGSGGDGGGGSSAPALYSEADLLDITEPTSGFVDLSRLYSDVFGSGIFLYAPFVTSILEQPSASYKQQAFIVQEYSPLSGLQTRVRIAEDGSWISGDWSVQVGSTPTLEDVLTKSSTPANLRSILLAWVDSVYNSTATINGRSATYVDGETPSTRTSLGPKGVAFTRGAGLQPLTLAGPDNVSKMQTIKLPDAEGTIALTKDLPPEPPESGNYVLKSVDGTLSWVAEA